MACKLAQSCHMDACMHCIALHIYLSNTVWYAMHIVHRSRWIKTMQFCQYLRCIEQITRGTLFRSLCVCMWILFKCTFPLMVNAPWHWLIRSVVRLLEWQTISVTNTRAHTQSFACMKCILKNVDAQCRRNERFTFQWLSFVRQ